MGWAERRMQSYARGEKASFLEKKTLEHAHPGPPYQAFINLLKRRRNGGFRGKMLC